ncbi:MAG: uracil-xanthine permease, partial [Clostridia bacterium]|nr:uracil-xanthine permease [Clostridia bacterium]
SSIIDRDLISDPGLDKTLLGDGVGSMVGAFFGGCPNTTYGESIGCVAISGNASVWTITCTSVMAIIASFITPFVTLLSTIPSCVMGGVCFALYGFIAVSGLKMLQKVDLGDNKNLFTVSSILIAGVGGLSLTFAFDAGQITLTSVACALILGIVVRLIASSKFFNKEDAASEEAAPAEVAADEGDKE